MLQLQVKYGVHYVTSYQLDMYVRVRIYMPLLVKHKQGILFWLSYNQLCPVAVWVCVLYQHCFFHPLICGCRQCHMEEVTTVGDTTEGEGGGEGATTITMEDGDTITIITTTVDVGEAGDGVGGHTDMLDIIGELL